MTVPYTPSTFTTAPGAILGPNVPAARESLLSSGFDTALVAIVGAADSIGGNCGGKEVLRAFEDGVMLDLGPGGGVGGA